MRKIIEFHVHLGDIFMGRNVSFRTRLMRPELLDDGFTANARSGFTFSARGKKLEDVRDRIQQGHRRMALATLENLGSSLDEAGIAHAVLMPVLPYTSFDEYLAASRLDSRLIPFTSADFSLPEPDMLEKLRQDIALGARGLKLHAVLQNVAMTDPRTLAAVEVFAQAGLPVLAHIGISYYHLPEQGIEAGPEFGSLDHFMALARTFPRCSMVAAHCANTYGGEFARTVEGLDNVFTDTTHCSAAHLIDTVRTLGEDRVVFGTDFPFGNMVRSLEIVDEAFPDDAHVKDRLLYANSAGLLGL